MSFGIIGSKWEGGIGPFGEYKLKILFQQGCIANSILADVRSDMTMGGRYVARTHSEHYTQYGGVEMHECRNRSRWGSVYHVSSRLLLPKYYRGSALFLKCAVQYVCCSTV